MKRILAMGLIVLTSVMFIGCDLSNVNQADFNEVFIQALEKCYGDEVCESIVEEEFNKQLDESEIILNIDARLAELERIKQQEMEAKHNQAIEVGTELFAFLEDYNTNFQVFNIETIPNIQEDNSTTVNIVIDYIPILTEKNLTLKSDLDTGDLEIIEEEFNQLKQDIVDYLKELNADFDIILNTVEYNDINSTDEIITEIDWQN